MAANTITHPSPFAPAGGDDHQRSVRPVGVRPPQRLAALLRGQAAPPATCRALQVRATQPLSASTHSFTTQCTRRARLCLRMRETVALRPAPRTDSGVVCSLHTAGAFALRRGRGASGRGRGDTPRARQQGARSLDATPVCHHALTPTLTASCMPSQMNDTSSRSHCVTVLTLTTATTVLAGDADGGDGGGGWGGGWGGERRCYSGRASCSSST
jgi:hypothetical protein